MLLFGLGAGLGFPSLAMLAMSGTAPDDAGLASGLVNTSMQLGGAVGLAVLATLATERSSHLQAGGAPAASALNAGYHVAYLVAAALVGLALAVALTTLREPRRRAGAGVVRPDAATSAQAR
jgi:MFS family permease